MRSSRFFTIAFTLVWALAIAWGSLTPGSNLPSELPWDKFNHLAGYGGLTLGLLFAGLRTVPAVVTALVYGIAIEYAQLWVPGRSGGDWADILANALGAIGVALGAMSVRRLVSSTGRRA
ncbi:VanZ family protein [Salinicola halophilus]|uniref:VanZ family protein n=1 Tax=Salinicola halophilus TaxID=184065 RepID=UPI000DA25D70|nr:VanZ family protein [Salinicola halophilus]